VLIEVTNEVSSAFSPWTFVIGTAKVRRLYAGHDLEELSQTFNDVIRELINHLEADKALYRPARRKFRADECRFPVSRRPVAGRCVGSWAIGPGGRARSYCGIAGRRFPA
jgi:hypothetical protein